MYDEDKEECRLIWVEKGKKRSLLLPSRPEAEHLAKPLCAQIAPKQTATVRDVMVAWADDRGRAGRCKPQSTLHMLARMRGFFGVALTMDIRGLSGARAAKLYEQAVEHPTRKTGEPPSAAMYRFDLWAGRGGRIPLGRRRQDGQRPSPP